MAKKNYYYVLVCTTEGAKFVTGTGNHHMAYWDVTKPPMNFSKDYAEDIANGLAWNGYFACVVCSKYEITQHPYNYEEYECEWKKKEVVRC